MMFIAAHHKRRGTHDTQWWWFVFSHLLWRIVCLHIVCLSPVQWNVEVVGRFRSPGSQTRFAYSIYFPGELLFPYSFISITNLTFTFPSYF